MVRVPSSRLDRLVGLVGELVMNHSRLAQAAALVGARELAAPVEEIDRLVSELRDSVLGIRMMPIGSVIGHQTVIQPLGNFLKKIEVASGSTVMGDGRVALILDVAAVVRQADMRACPGALAAAAAPLEAVLR
jgi:chemotaxis protein histidine kinase CheA